MDRERLERRGPDPGESVAGGNRKKSGLGEKNR